MYAKTGKTLYSQLYLPVILWCEGWILQHGIPALGSQHPLLVPT